MFEKMGQYKILKYMLVFGLTIVFLAIVMVFMGTNTEAGTNFSPAIVIDASISAADDVMAADIDDDGDMDLLVAAYSDNSIYWNENLDGMGTFGTKQTIDSSSNQATSVFAADIDGDFDLDVLATARSDDTVAWFENLDGNGTFGAKQTIDNTLDAAKDVQAGDIDKDGNMDVVACGWGGAGFIAWYNNTNGDGSAWTPDVIDGTTVSAFRVVLADIDGDTDLDVVACDRDNNHVMWYENTDGGGNFGPALTIGTPMGPQGVFATDIDGDLDLDVVSANSNSQNCEWYENTDGNGNFGPANVINDSIEAPIRVFAADLDLDGDSDVICASGSNETLLWFENLDGLGTFSGKRILNDTIENSGAVFAADIDNDGDLDVLSGLMGSVIWFRNYFGDVYNLDKDIFYGDIQSGMNDADSGNRLMILGKYTGGFVVDGKTIIIVDSAFDSTGDVKIINGGSLTVDPTYWNQTGNISVDALSTLILDDTILQMNSSFNGEFGIQVNGTGTMNIQNNSVVEAQGTFPYWFTVLDAAIFSVEDSTIRDCGWNDTNPGLWVDADGAYLNNATLTNNYNGIILNSTAPSQIIDCDILSSTYRGVQFIASDTTLINVNISGADNGIGCFQGSSPWIINSTISGTTSNSFILFQNSHPTALNTTFDKGQVLVTDPLSDLTVKWYLHVYCYDSGGLPVPNAYVNITDSFGTETPMGQTDAGGWIRWFQVTEYVQGQTFWNPYSPYKIIAEIPAYYGSEMVDIDQSLVVNVMLGLQRVHNIDKDLWYAGIQKAVDDADAGNHIEIYNGTYNETVIVDRALTIMAVYPGNCTVDGNGHGNTFTVTAEGVEITGLIIANHLDTFGIYCTAGGFYIHENVFAVEEIGVGIDLEDIGVDMSGVTSVNISDMTIDGNDFNSGYMGILVRIQNIGYNLSDNAAVNLGAIYITDNTMTTYHGIYMERVEYIGYIMSGNALFTWDGFEISGNDIYATGDGIYSYFSYLAHYMYDDAQANFSDFLLTDNNITSDGDGIFIYMGESAYNMFNDTTFTMGDFLIDSNMINATGYGIFFEFVDSAYNMYDNAIAAFGDFWVIGNDITSADESVSMKWDTIGYNMYNYTSVSIGEAHIENNALDMIGGFGMAIDSYPVAVGTNMYGNSFLTYGDWYVDGNSITSVNGGIYTGPQYAGYELYGMAMVVFHDYYVRNNTIDVTNDEGLYIEYTDCGESLHDFSWVVGGNMSVYNNTVYSDNSYGYYMYYNYMGYDMYNDSYANFGWYDSSHNNFSSNNSNGAYLEIYYLGAFMYGDSQAYLGDITFLYNEFWAGTLDAVLWYLFFENAFYMYDNSFFMLGDVLFNWNYMNTPSGDGVDLDDWDDNGYNMYNSSDAVYGDFEFNNNTLVVGQSGIDIDDWDGWADTMYGTSTFTMGHIQMNDNNITSGSYGIYHTLAEFANYMEGNSMFWMEDIEVLRNEIDSASEGIYVDLGYFAYYMDDNSSARFGSFLFDENDINAGTHGMDVAYLEYCAYEMYANASATFGDFSFSNNNITAGLDGIYFYAQYIGHLMFNGSTFEIGNIEFCDNTINSSDDGIYVDIVTVAYDMHSDATFFMADILMNDNTLDTAGKGIYFAIHDCTSYLYDDTTVTFGDFYVTANNITSQDICIEFLMNAFSFTFAYEMHNQAFVSIGAVHIEGNEVNQTTAFVDAIVAESYRAGNDMYGDSFLTFGDWYVDGNTVISSGAGIYTGRGFCGYNMYDYSQVIFHDYYVRNNVVDAQEGGLSIWFYDFGELLFNYSRIIGGNISVIGNNATTQNWWGLELYYDTMGINVLDNSFASFGWCDISYNNFSSVNYYGGIIGVDYVGSVLDGSSQAYIGDIAIENNEFWSTNSDGLYLDQFHQTAYELFDSSYVQIGDVLVNDNYVNAGGNGIYLDTWTENAYNMYQFASADLGNFEFNRNIIEAGGSGINENLVQNWATNLFGDNNVTIGHWQFNYNTITAVNNGIYWEPNNFGTYLYGNSTAIIGNNFITGNEINVESGHGLYAWWWYDFANEMYDNSTCMVGDSIIMNNVINVTGAGADSGIWTGPYESGDNVYDGSTAIFGDYIVSHNVVNAFDTSGIQFSIYWVGYNMDGLASVTIGNISVSNNIINSTNGNGIYISETYENGYMLYGNAKVTMGRIEFNDNQIEAGDNGIYFLPTYGFGYFMYEYSIFEMGDFNFIDNTINANNNGIYWEPYYYGAYLYGNSTAIIGNNFITGNEINVADDHGIYAWWWYYYAYEMYDNSTCIVGDSVITYNIINVTGSGEYGIYTGPYDSSENLFANSTAIFGDYIVSYNTINANDSYGIEFDIYQTGYEMYDDSNASFGQFQINDNNITTPNGIGLYIYNYQLAYNVYNNSYLSLNDLMIANNIITAQTIGIDITYSECGGLYNTSTAYLPGIQVLGNWVDSASSAFIYTTTFTPFNNDPGATQVWGDVIIDGNDFDAGMYGVVLDWQNPDPTVAQPVFYIRNTNIHDGLGGSIGLMLINIASAYGEKVTINTVDYGIYTNNSAVHEMINSTLVNCAVLDISLYSDSYIFMVNSTFDNSSVFFEDFDSLLEVGWFMNVLVQSQVPLPIPGATVAVADVDGTEIFNGTTNAEGKAFYIICTEYLENITGINKNFNDYTANATAGLNFGVAVPDPTMNQTRLVIITFIDVVPPNIFGDNSDTAGTTGDPFYFEINATDDLGIVSVHVNYRFNGVGFYTNLTMSGTGPYWLTEILPPNPDGFIEYYFTAVDSGGFWVNTTPTNAPITDNDPPTIISDNSDTVATTGDTFNFIVDASDNINISEVHVVWWFGAGAPTNDTMTGTGPYTFSIPVPPDSLDQLHYYFTMNDTSDNWLVGPQVDVDVTDNDAPTYVWDLQPTAGTTGESVLVSIQAIDNIDLPYYKIDIDGTLYDMVKDGNYYNYTINVPPDNVADITYSIILNDSANNPNNIAPTVINVADNDAPTFVWDLQPTTGTTGESVLVSIQAFDNIGVSYYKIDIDGILYDLIKDGNYYNITINVPPDNLVNITYYAVFNDSSNNPNSTALTNITITDNDAPTYNWVFQPTVGVAGTSVDVSLQAFDNIGVVNYTIYVNGTPYDMVKDGDYYNFTINIPPGSTADIAYNVTFRDAEGNVIETGDTMITVIPTDTEAPILTWVSQPTAGTTGESVLVSILATDNVGVTYYKIDVDGTLYDLIKDGDHYNFTINIPPDNLADITYSLIFNDSSDNQNSTTPTVITVTDNDAPQYIWVSQPIAGTTGDTVVVSIQATDNIGITYYRIDIDGTLYDMVKDEDFYNYTIDVPTDSIANITYSIVLNDSANNQITIPGTVITVSDDDEPTYVWVLQPTAGTAGDSIVVSLMALDNIGVTNYTITIDGESYDMVKDGDYYNYTIVLPTDGTTSITYNITFMDGVINENTTADTVITISPIDDEAPTYIWILHPDTGTTGDAVQISLLATDNVGITTYQISIDDILNDLEKDGDYYNYTFIVPSDGLTDIIYIVIFKDDANNEITLPGTTVTVSDNDAPTNLVATSDTTATTGDTFTFEVDAIDNIGIHEVHVVYWFGTDSPTNVTMNGTGPYDLDITIPVDSLDTLHYYFAITDEAGNWLVGTQVDISITDDQAATISNEASDESGKEDETFTFQIDASDNVGISQVRVAYWFGDDESQKQFITLTETDGTYSGSFTPEQSGTMNYYFEVTDAGGNVVESDDYTVDVASKDKEEEGVNPIFFILPIIVIIILLLLFLLLRKKKEEEVPPEEEMADELLEGEELEEGGVEPEEELGEGEEEFEGEFEEGEPSEEMEEEGLEFEEGVEEEPSEEFELEEESGEEPEWEEGEEESGEEFEVEEESGKEPEWEEEGGEEFQVEEEPSEEFEPEEESGEGNKPEGDHEEPSEETEPEDTTGEGDFEGETEDEEKKTDELDDILNGL